MLPESATILRVLLVEADERDGQRLLDALRGGGHAVYARRVAAAADWPPALNEENWDIVLLAGNVPDLAPEDVLDMLRDLRPSLPVVLAVDGGVTSLPAPLLENGACDFVFKSNPSRLLAVVERECSKALFNREKLATQDEDGLLREGEARFLQLASNIPECYWLVDAQTQQVTYVSKAYEQIWGRYVEALYSDNRDWLKFVHVDDRSRLAKAMDQNVMGGLDEKFRVERPDGSLRWLHARSFPVHDEEGRVVSVGGIASDITGQIAEQREMPYFAHFDALTALPNQMMFYDQARRLIALSRRKSLPLAVMLVDIDRFHEVNQMLGYNSGDEVLRQVAARLSGSLRESDIVGRLGGDTFAVLLPEVADSIQASIVARRVIDTLALPLQAEGQEVFATASIGLAFHDRDGRDVHELVNSAEIAMRDAKAQGRNCYHFYTPAMHDDVRNRIFLETDLRNAMLRDEFVLHYQPKASCVSGHIVGAEALLRWNHPRRGIVSPDEFIPLLEETGLIVQVGRWVMETACKQVLAWQRDGLEIPSVSVNLSARQLGGDTLLEDVSAILARTGLSPECLDLEITESMLMQGADRAILTLNGLKEMGVTLSLDDFGTGYSSLAYLKRFPLDTVKVDRSFVQDITADSDDASITRAVITMAHHLKLKVVAEGVETSEQLALLISHQCDVIQGYFFARPLPPADFVEVLRSGQRLPAHLLRSGTRRPIAMFVGVHGQDEVVGMLETDGYRIGRVDDYAGAMDWFGSNLADVLVVATADGFDAVAMLRRGMELQPDCERLLLVDEAHWNDAEVAELGSAGVVHRVVRLPVEASQLHDLIDEALRRRRIADEYVRLTHEVELAERQLVRVEEERRRLRAENVVLHDNENLGFIILQEVVGSLPWPVIGVDGEGILALVNSVAAETLPGRGLVPGQHLADVLPELQGDPQAAKVTLDGQAYSLWTRPFRLGPAVSGTLLLLQKG